MRNPTVVILDKIAKALKVPAGEQVAGRAAEGRVLIEEERGDGRTNVG